MDPRLPNIHYGWVMYFLFFVPFNLTFAGVLKSLNWLAKHYLLVFELDSQLDSL